MERNEKNNLSKTSTAEQARLNPEENFSLPVSIQTPRASGRPLFGGEGYVICQFEQEGICHDATGNPPFLVRFTMRIDITILAGLGHFFPIGFFPQTGWHCKLCFGSLLSRSIVGLVDLTTL